MLGDSIGNRFIFPAPDPSYGTQSYKRHLCWIPWNSVISPAKAGDERCTDGIPCLWFPAPKAATVIMFFHANAEDLGMSFAVLKHMRDQFKVNVLAVEYPGYGLLRGMVPSENAIYEVALTAFRFLVDEIGVRYSQIILFGRSLGSGPAVYLAAQYPVGGLILVSAFSSIRAAVQSIVGRLFAWTFKERFPNSRIIANVSCSTLFIHGECDGLIPAEHSLRLFKRCRARKLLITPPRMEHNSNLFGDASFLAVPAIHFFGFPGYYTSTPPRLPACLFENPDRRKRLAEQSNTEGSGFRPWLCDCLAKSDPHHLDVSFCRPDITIRFFHSGGGVAGGGNGGGCSGAGGEGTGNSEVGGGTGATNGCAAEEEGGADGGGGRGVRGPSPAGHAEDGDLHLGDPGTGAGGRELGQPAEAIPAPRPVTGQPQRSLLPSEERLSASPVDAGATPADLGRAFAPARAAAQSEPLKVSGSLKGDMDAALPPPPQDVGPQGSVISEEVQDLDTVAEAAMGRAAKRAEANAMAQGLGTAVHHDDAAADVGTVARGQRGADDAVEAVAGEDAPSRATADAAAGAAADMTTDKATQGNMDPHATAAGAPAADHVLRSEDSEALADAAL